MDDTRPRAEILAELEALRAEIDALARWQHHTSDPASTLGFSETVARFRELIRSLGIWLLDIDSQGCIVGCGTTSRELIGKPAAPLVGMPGSELVHPDEKIALESFVAGHQTRASQRFRIRHDNGEWRHFELQMSSGVRADGSGPRLIFARNVTAEHDVVRELRSSQDRYRTLAENMTDLIVEIDSAGRFLYVSPSCEELIGYTPEQLLGSDVESILRENQIQTDERDQLLDGFRNQVQARGEGGRRIYRVRHTDGRQLWLDSRARTYRTANGAIHAVVISRDVTELVAAQGDLADLEKRYAMLGETSRDLITEIGPEGTFVYLSPNARALLGYEPEELIGTPPMDLAHPADRDRVLNDFAPAPETPQVAFTPPYRCRLKDGSYRWFEGSGTSYTRPDSGETYTIGLLRDVHERVNKREAERALEERVQRAQRLEGLGVMAGGIAHDFNNLLTPILGQSSLALMDLPENTELHERIEKVRNAARRAAKLTNQMLAYAGAGPLLFEATDLSELVREMGQLLESTVSGKAVIHFELADELAPIEADGAQISQVVMNLIANAAEAVGDGNGTISVRTRRLPGSAINKGDLVLGEADPALSYVCFEVEDTGVGMDSATRSRIFDPFFTTKFTGRGLGLAAVLGIVRGHDGAIELDTEQGRGTRFRVLLPPYTLGEPALAESSTASTWSSSGFILLADDDAGVRDLSVETLERCGFTVLIARNGREALEQFDQYGDQIRAVLLDRTMPIVSGEETFATLRRKRPYLPVIIVSGYSEESATLAIAENRPDGFLKKPFQPEVLIETIRKVLDD
ncbi:MAG: PAS domain S-box protein [Myxococcota bacterium]|nr:PAS domain S-box protein [Myxococcota bacterium]